MCATIAVAIVPQWRRAGLLTSLACFPTELPAKKSSLGSGVMAHDVQPIYNEIRDLRDVKDLKTDLKTAARNRSNGHFTSYMQVTTLGRPWCRCRPDAPRAAYFRLAARRASRIRVSRSPPPPARSVPAPFPRAVLGLGAASGPPRAASGAPRRRAKCSSGWSLVPPARSLARSRPLTALPLPSSFPPRLAAEGVPAAHESRSTSPGPPRSRPRPPRGRTLVMERKHTAHRAADCIVTFQPVRALRGSRRGMSRGKKNRNSRSSERKRSEN